MTAGWPFEEFQRVTGHDLREGWEGAMKTWVARNQAVLETGRFRLNREGLRFADAVAQDFLR